MYLRIDTTNLNAMLAVEDEAVAKATSKLIEATENVRYNRDLIEYAADVIGARAFRNIIVNLDHTIKSVGVFAGHMTVTETTEDRNGSTPTAWSGEPTMDDVLAAIGLVRQNCMGVVVRNASRPLSRSTSVPSNITDDLEAAAAVSFAGDYSFPDFQVNGEYVSKDKVGTALRQHEDAVHEARIAARLAEEAARIELNGSPTNAAGEALDGRKVGNLIRKWMKEMGEERYVVARKDIKAAWGYTGIGVNYDGPGSIVLHGNWNDDADNETGNMLRPLFDTLIVKLATAGYKVQPAEVEYNRHTAKVTGFIS